MFFDKGLSQSGLIPKAKQTKWLGDTDACLYDINETDIDKAMIESRKRIVQYLNACYEIAENHMDDATKDTFLFSNRATFPFVTIAGLLNSYLYTCGEINATTPIKERVNKITPYIKVLCKGLNVKVQNGGNDAGARVSDEFAPLNAAGIEYS